MGYTTDFYGGFDITPTLKPEHRAYLYAFARTRRVMRDEELTKQRPDPIRVEAFLPVGKEGGYFVNEDGFAGQTDGPDVTNHNNPPMGQPGLWCQWIPNEEGTALIWDEGEKFYEYVPWLEYLIDHFLAPWGYTLNGEVDWVGEDGDDRGKIVVTSNRIQVLIGRVVYS